ncbi:MAG: N-acetyl-gamma-glutamyl-phosphate reductase [Halobacteriota archaeon]|nr:N-acetyl-gamma-glutamyl-phosphate reductase [Halobacteriota archaeon]
MIDVGVIGGSGYTGVELIRLISNHPGVKIKIITSRRFEGRKISDVHPHLRSISELFYEGADVQKVADVSDLVFTAVPHGTAMEYVPELLECGVRVVDLSADYRLNPDEYKRVYGKEADRRDAVYGLPELHSEISKAELVANPGCYPTGAILAVVPLVKNGVVKQVVFDSKSGITGAGADPTEVSHYPNLAENIVAYKITTHRHKAEIVQELDPQNKVHISFTPHVIPCKRGILTTAHVFVNKDLSHDDIDTMYQEFYEGKPFIRLTGIPSLGSVRGSNFCDIGFEIEEGTNRIVVISAIDNLIKGASGQAIQSMNLMLGLDEKTGLWMSGFSP